MNSLGDKTSPPGTYVLGHSDRELERLSTQARLIDPPVLASFRAHGFRGVATSEMGNHVVRDGMYVFARYFYRKSVRPDDWKDIAKLAGTGPAKQAFYLRTG